MADFRCLCGIQFEAIPADYRRLPWVWVMMGNRLATVGRWTNARLLIQAVAVQVASLTPGTPGDHLALTSRRPSGCRPTPARVLDQCGSDTRTGECHMRDSAGRGGDLDLVVVLEALQSVPEPYASAEQDRDHHYVRVVDEAGRKKLADHGRTSADAYMLAPGSLAGCLERLGGRGVEEVERRAALHLD